MSFLERTLKKGFWAQADQGVVSLGNFLCQIVLARSLSAANYGIFALLFGVMLVLLTCHGSLITYPLSLKGAVADPKGLRNLTSQSVTLTLLLSAFLAPIVFAAAWVLKVRTLSWCVLLALVLWLVQETLRRGLMAHLRHREAIWGDCASYLGQAAILWLIARHGRMTLPAAFLVLAITSGAAAIVQGAQLRVLSLQVRKATHLVRDFWSLGGWALFSNSSDTGYRQSLPWALAFLFGAQAAASFQALMNVLGVSHPVLFGTSNLVIPAASAAKERKGSRTALKISVLYGGMATALVGPYFGLLLLWPHKALALFYGQNSPYAGMTLELRLAVVTYFVAIIGAFLLGYILGIGRPKYAFAANFGATAIAAAPAAILIVKFGVAGAVEALLAWVSARLLICALLSWRSLRTEETAMPVQHTLVVPGDRKVLGSSVEQQ